MFMMILKINFEGQILLVTVVSIQCFEMTLQSVAGKETGSSDTVEAGPDTRVHGKLLIYLRLR